VDHASWQAAPLVPRARAPWICLALLVLLAWAGGCRARGIVIEVHALDLAPATKNLAITPRASTGGATFRTLSVTYSLERFFIELPAETEGLISLRAEGLRSDGCILQTSSAVFSATQPPPFLELRMQTEVPSLCTVTLDVETNGTDASVLYRIQGSDAPVVPCTEHCTVEVPPKATLLLTPQPGQGQFIGWIGGDCETRVQCELAGADRARAVRALFAPRQVCSADGCATTARSGSRSRCLTTGS
jgi:hypothetical protein